jgi:hypothetical protein
MPAGAALGWFPGPCLTVDMTLSPVPLEVGASVPGRGLYFDMRGEPPRLR